MINPNWRRWTNRLCALNVNHGVRGYGDDIEVIEARAVDELQAEIERLTAQLNEFNEYYTFHELERVELLAESYRSKFLKIIAADAEYSTHSPGVSRLKHCVAIARAALEEKHD